MLTLPPRQEVKSARGSMEPVTNVGNAATKWLIVGNSTHRTPQKDGNVSIRKAPRRVNTLKNVSRHLKRGRKNVAMTIPPTMTLTPPSHF